ncbi:hypothetical protein C8R44DRAFT_720520 [Mycena epipterygia]|nr:hypothetical protein C8R44DRAFT_720520 [Mycena epipterygia]
MADRIRERLVHLRADLDTAVTRAEKSESRIKALGQVTLEREHEIKSLQVRLAQSDNALEKTEQKCKEALDKLRQVEDKAEHFERQVQGMERERDQWEKKFEAVREKYQKSQAELADLEKSMQDL